MKDKKRLIIIACGTFFLFSLLLMQYFKIQIVEGEKWTKIALSQHEFILKEPAKRGSFYSNIALKKGHPEKLRPLVSDVTKFHLYVDPQSIPEQFKEEVALNLVTHSKVSSDEKGHFKEELSKKSRSRKLAMWLEKDAKEGVLNWWIPYAKKKKIPSNAVYFVTDYLRSYPFGKLLGQVLHTIREIKDENTNVGVPTGGLEAKFNDFLKGKQGVRKLLRSPLNPLETDTVMVPPEDGADIYLTINHYLQAVAEEELEKGVKAAKAKGGWAVLMDVHTGEIYALAQVPSFVPSQYKEFFNDPEKIEDSKVKVTTDAFELGSIMKPITLACALKANEELKKQNKPTIFDPYGKVDTTRVIFPGRGNKPLHETRRYNALNMFMALQKSSNIYMAQIIDRVVHTMGNDWYRNVLTNTFAFGKKTGIELPAEALGCVPTPGKMHPNGTLEWSIPTPYSLAIGHNLMATGLQMLRAYAVFANGGFLVEPTLIRKIVKKDKEGQEVILVDHTKKERFRKFPRVLSKNAAKEVLKATKFTTKPGGTASLADILGYSEGGKTGTAEKIIEGSYDNKRHISSFIGFFPANVNDHTKNRFVLLVTIDDPEFRILPGGIKAHHGGRCAAPIYREIGRKTLEYVGIAPDDPFGYPAGDPRHNPEKADFSSELNELKALFEKWNK